MSNLKIILRTTIHFLICISGLLVIQEVSTGFNELPQAFHWIWLSICALSLPTFLEIDRRQIEWQYKHWVILIIIISMIPFVRVPSNETWQLSSVLIFLLYQLLGPAICEELYFRARFYELTKDWKGPILLGLFNGLIFSIAHILIRGFELLSGLTFFPGILLWIIYTKNKNLITVILLHWLLNTGFYAVFYRLNVILPDFLEKILV